MPVLISRQSKKPVFDSSITTIQLQCHHSGTGLPVLFFAQNGTAALNAYKALKREKIGLY